MTLFYPAIFSAVHHVADSFEIQSYLPNQDSSIDVGRLELVGGALLTAGIVVHLYQQNGWWKDNRAPFHFQEDLVYDLNVDKIGHFYGGYVLEFTISRCLMWANVPDIPAMWFGSGGALLFQTYVEVEDGFSTWGFDRVDFASDVGGAAWPIARYYVPFLRNFDLKMSYHPSQLLGEAGGVGFPGQKHLVIDDDEGQTFWMGVKVHDLLPDSWRSYWPDYLSLAVGTGVRNLQGGNPYRVFFLAPDLDMTRIIPPKTSFLKTLGEVLNFIHMPLPAVQISPGAIWYGVYF